MIRGTIEPYARGTLGRLSMRMHPFVTGFTALWMKGAALGGVVAAIANLSLLPLATLFLPLAGASLAGFAFRGEANLAIEALCVLWDAREELAPED